MARNLIAIDEFVGPTEWLVKAIKSGYNVEHNQAELAALEATFKKFGFGVENAIDIEHAVYWHCPGRHGAFLSLRTEMVDWILGYLTIYSIEPGKNLWGKPSPDEPDCWDIEFIPWAGIEYIVPWALCGSSIAFGLLSDLTRISTCDTHHTIPGLEDVCRRVKELAR